MGKIGFRIRSTREVQVPVYVYVYWLYGAGEEVKRVYTVLFNKYLKLNAIPNRITRHPLLDL